MSGENNEERDEKGQYKKQIEDKKFIQTVQKNQPIGTKEVAKKLDIHEKTALKRLNKLNEKTKIKKKIIGNNSVWYTE